MDFDVVVLGTGLSESITAAALSKAGYKVAHLDANAYYGADDASLSLDELVQWANDRSNTSKNEQTSLYLETQRSRYTDISCHGSLPPQSRQYAVSLRPTVIPSVGPLIDSLIASGVSRYGGFKLLEQVALYGGPGKVKRVPGSKEDIFKDKRLSLLQKRRLMRFLMFAGGEFEGKPELEGSENKPFPAFLKEKFSLENDSVQAIAYALAFCVSDTDPTLPALQRIRRYLRSTGRYGPSPFLVGHYGGIGEIAQGFCRTAAVGGATYILGQTISSLSTQPSDGAPKHVVKLADLPEELRCDYIVSSPDNLNLGISEEALVASSSSSEQSGAPVARCIAVIDRPLLFSTNEPLPEASTEDTNEDDSGPQSPPDYKVDTAMLVFPPGELPSGASSVTVHALVAGEASLSAPRGYWVVHLSMPLKGDETSTSAEQLLQPYLDAVLSLAQLSELADTPDDPVKPLWTLFFKELSSAHPPHITEVADTAVGHAESVFWKAVDRLKKAGRRPQKTNEEGLSEGRDGDVEAFWPPLDYVEEEDEM